MGLNVSRPWLPDWNELGNKLQETWDTGWLTHNGPLVREFEERLAQLWGVGNVIVVANGTLAIQLALRALGASGNVITSPFTWKATATAIVWENLKPVFADISSDNLCLDPEKVEELINEETGCILPINVYGNPPNFKEFSRISDKYGIPVVYDAAHAACTKIEGKSCLSFGDISATSFHATKLIHTAEGGACITENADLADRLRALRFFGFGESDIEPAQGTNAKMTEIHAAIGLCVLDNLQEIMSIRKEICEIYENCLGSSELVKFGNFSSKEFSNNHIYFPIIFNDEEKLEECVELLNQRDIYPRRYFHPSVNMIEGFIQANCPVSESFSKRVLCLPLSPLMSPEDAHRVVSSISHIL